MVKFLHTGDLHLGLKFNSASFPREKAMERRRELWSTFERIVQYAKDNKIDFLLIAGDLFETDYFAIGDITRIRDTFRKAEDVNVIISAGNHDYKGSRSLYHRIEWTSNVTIFEGNRIQEKEFPELNTVIYGYSWDTMEIREHNLFDELAGQVDREKNNILLIHGDVNSTSTYLPLKVKDLTNLNMDYIALGHIHKPEILTPNMAYCGSPEPLDFGEVGDRGIIVGQLKSKQLEIDFLPFSKRKFHLMDIDIDENMGYPDIVDRVKNISLGQRENDFYRINLKGFIQADISVEGIHGDLVENFYHIEIENNTVKDYNLDELVREHEDNIIGQFILKMQSMGLEDPLVRNALYYGLESLMRGN